MIILKPWQQHKERLPLLKSIPKRWKITGRSSLLFAVIIAEGDTFFEETVWLAPTALKAVMRKK